MALTNGELVFSSDMTSWDNYFEKLTAHGEQIWGKFLPFPIHDLSRSPGDSILLLSEAGLYIFGHMVGDSLAHFPQIIGERLETLPDGRYLMQQGEILQLYSPTFEWLAEASLANSEITDLTFDENQIVILAQPPHVFMFDMSLEPLGDFSLTGADHSFGAVAVRENKILLGGADGHGSSPHSNSSSFLKSYSLDGTTTDYGKDVGVESVEPVFPMFFISQLIGMPWCTNMSPFL